MVKIVLKILLIMEVPHYCAFAYMYIDMCMYDECNVDLELNEHDF